MAIFSLICVVEDDLTSLCGSGTGSRDCVTGEGVIDRAREVGRLARPWPHPETNRKLGVNRQYEMNVCLRDVLCVLRHLEGECVFAWR